MSVMERERPPPASHALTERQSTPAPARLFHGWWIVAACAVISCISNTLGLFGAGIYLRAITEANGWSTALVSGAATMGLILSALLMVPVTSAIGRLGPRKVIGAGAAALAIGVAALGRVDQPWQVYLAFLAIGLAMACMTTTAIATTLAPWFDHLQGRAMSLASLGISASGIAGAPALLFAVRQIGFQAAVTVAGAVGLGLTLLCLTVVYRRPSDLGLFPDGGPPRERTAAREPPRVTRRQALRTPAVVSVMIAFGLGMMAQIGFLTHQVPLISSTLGAAGTSAAIAATSISALTGRMLLARFADHVPLRQAACGVLIVAAAALTMLALWRTPAVLFGASIALGLTMGNVTTLSPIIIRREFGAASFGPVFGVASTGIMLASACGPGLYGALHDLFGGYHMPLLIVAVLDLVAAAVVIIGGRMADEPATGASGP